MRHSIRGILEALWVATPARDFLPPLVWRELSSSCILLGGVTVFVVHDDFPFASSSARRRRGFFSFLAGIFEAILRQRQGEQETNLDNDFRDYSELLDSLFLTY